MVGLFGRHFFSVVAIKGGIGSPPAEQGLSETYWKSMSIRLPYIGRHSIGDDRIVFILIDQGK